MQVKSFAEGSSLQYFRPSLKIVSENDQEIPQSQTADNPVALRGRAAQLSRDTSKATSKVTICL